MSDILNKNLILLNQSFDDKHEAIVATGELLARNGYVSREYIQSMLDREKSSTIYVGNNVAIPHGVLESDKYIFKSGISFIQVPDGVMFDDNPAYLIIGVAGKSNTHVDILSKIATIVMDEKNVEKLRYFSVAEDVLNIFKK